MRASVHVRFATRYSGRGEDIDRLPRGGVSVDLDRRWNVNTRASERLIHTPSAFGTDDVQGLRAVRLTHDEIAELVFAAAVFNRINRLMPSLGESEAPWPRLQRGADRAIDLVR